MKWSDGQPLTAEDVAYTVNRSRDEAWLNHTAIDRQPDRKATSPTDGRDQSKVPDPKLPTMDVYIVPKHIYEQYDAKATHEVERPDGRRRRPVQARRVQEGPVRALQGQPGLLGRQAGGRRGRDPHVQQRRRDGRRAQERRGRLRPEHARGPVPQPPEGSGDRASKGAQGGFDEFAINGGDGLKKAATPRSRTQVREAIAHAIDKQTIVDRVLRGIGEPGRGREPVGEPDWTPEIPEDQRFDVRPREVASRSSTTRATRTRTATASARCRAAASR